MEDNDVALKSHIYSLPTKLFEDKSFYTWIIQIFGNLLLICWITILSKNEGLTHLPFMPTHKEVCLHGAFHLKDRFCWSWGHGNTAVRSILG